MIDGKKVMEGLSNIRNEIVDGYINDPERAVNTLTDALELLEKQEPKQVLSVADSIKEMDVGYCPSCRRGIANKMSDPTKFCRYCGQAVKWNV